MAWANTDPEVEVDRAGAFEAGEVTAAVIDQGLRERGARVARHHGLNHGFDFFPQILVGDTHHRDIEHLGVGEE